MTENSIDAEARVFGKTPIVIRYPAGPRGDSFNPDAVGNFADRANFNTQPENFAYLAHDLTPPLLYFRRTATAGVWSLGIPYGRGEDGTGDKYYEWAQNSASMQWGPIPHNFGRYPNPGALDSAGNHVQPGIIHIDVNSCYLTFSLPTSGKGYLT